ncbi:MAG: glutamine ABC transporter substrate-binding protein, partial [Tannerellaceae bacterium]|nr:glutamine ABC transporter substrate-binding protein [Tannerellaceae bacterium]
MKSKKLLLVYVILLTVILAYMVRLRNNRPEPLLPRDYPEIAEEGILRMVTEYNKEGYFVIGDTIEGFHYELSQAISEVSGLEVRIQLEMSLTESFNTLNNNQTAIGARNIP